MTPPRPPPRSGQRLTATRRERASVTPLELFFDLVFVLAVTQCTALMADDTTASGVVEAMAVLALLWWAWGGYAWLTSTVDPEEGIVRLVMFAAMAAYLVVALCVPEAFGDLATTFVVGYAVVRGAHLALYALASRGAPALRHSVATLSVSSAIGIGLLLAAATTSGGARAALWAVALTIDVAGPYFFGVAGWELVPEHFSERFGLIVIIALGESIVAVGIGSEVGVDGGVIAAAVLGVVLAAAQWWAYFDVVATDAARRLGELAPGQERNAMARDAYGYLHFPMVAGIVLVALGMEETISAVGEPLEAVPAVALVGGAALYLLASVAFRARTVHSVNVQRLVLGVAMLVLIPAARDAPALGTLAVLAALHVLLIVYEATRFAAARDEVRRTTAADDLPG